MLLFCPADERIEFRIWLTAWLRQGLCGAKPRIAGSATGLLIQVASLLIESNMNPFPSLQKHPSTYITALIGLPSSKMQIAFTPGSTILKSQDHDYAHFYHAFVCSDPIAEESIMRKKWLPAALVVLCAAPGILAINSRIRGTCRCRTDIHRKKGGKFIRMRFLTVFALLFAGAWQQAGSMSGLAVSSCQAPGSPCRTNGDARFDYGTIVKFTIQNDVVIRCDTIYKAYQATYPHLNLQGTKCAFIRRSIGQSGADHSANDIYSHLSILDLAVGTVTDIDSFFTWEFHTTQGGQLYYGIDWAANDYIYYVKQIKWSYSGDGPAAEVWKVKYNDPSTKALVYQYYDVKTFAVSLDATRAGITDITNNEFHCLPHAFPPAVNPTKNGWDSRVWVGCGTYISPSGKYHHHFFGGGHEAWRINTWNPPNELLASVDVSSGDFPAWSVDKNLTAETIGGGPMDWARWAVNSDKWITGCTQLYNMHVGPPFPQVGHNQVLVDWIGHKVIVTSRNWQASVTDCTKRQNDPGDLWIEGAPSGRCYENTDGNWVNVDNGSIVAVGPKRMTHLRVSLSQKATIYTIQGKPLGCRRLTKGATMESRKLPAGMYLVRQAASRRCQTSLLNIEGK